ncbi:MAG: glycoside hydrolase family 99-like domain-containing protein, partial [Acidimicrobiales bacterium]
VLDGSQPELFEHWLREVVARSEHSSTGEKVVFVNAWNEWAEGSYLEPDQRFGLGYLEAVRRVLDGAAQ